MWGILRAFGWNQIARGVLGRESFHPHFDELFERGIDPLEDSGDENESRESWPALSEVLAYRDQVREALLGCASEVLERADEDVLARGLRAYHIVLEHELMHHETLFYMLAELDHRLKIAPKDATPVLGSTLAEGASRVVRLPAGTVTLGADWGSQEFGWDNEFPEVQETVAAFELDRGPVTIGTFLDFVKDGGYRRAEFWSPEDFDWITRRRMQAPHRWQLQSGDGSSAEHYVRRTTFGFVPLDEVLAWPVLVSHAEASAYANYRGRRLPTEPELYLAAYGAPDGSTDRPYPWGSEEPTLAHGNFDDARYDPMPVGSHPLGQSAFSVLELLGNGWEWTDTTFEAWPGFEAWMRTYKGYSADFFDGQHKVLFGAAWPTSRKLLRRSFRNWFQRHYPYVFAKFRLANDV